MSAIENYEVNNVYYKIETPDTLGFQNIYVESENNNIYKAKVDCGDGNTRNATGTINPLTGGTDAKTYASMYNGYIKIYNNPLKVKKIFLDWGLFNTILLIPANIILTPAILDYFPNTEYFRFNYYTYNSKHPSLKGKVTGEWASKCGNKLKVLDISSNYPSDNATFNLNLFPSNSVIEEIRLQFNEGVTNFSVSGSVANIPATCKYVMLGGDTAVIPATNNVTGVIPNTIKEFYRMGRNTITGNVGNLNPNLRGLTLKGTNTLTGALISFPSLVSFQVQGNNTLSGSLSVLSNVTTIAITGQNTISGSIPSTLQCSTLIISGNNTLTGIIPVLIPLTIEINIQGNNTLTGLLNLPNVLNVTVIGQNTISSLNLPKAIGITIAGNNTLTGDLYSQVNPLIQRITIIGQNNTISTISGIFTAALGVNITGLNTLTGDIISKFPIARDIVISGNNTINDYVSKSYPSTMNNINISGLASLTTAMVDQIFIDLARDATTWGGVRNITLRGSCQPPSAASASARATLQSRLVTMSTN